MANCCNAVVFALAIAISLGLAVPEAMGCRAHLRLSSTSCGTSAHETTAGGLVDDRSSRTSGTNRCRLRPAPPTRPRRAREGPRSNAQTIVAQRFIIPLYYVRTAYCTW